MTAELRAETEAVCNAFVGTKHDVLSDLAELDEILTARDNSDGEAERRLKRAMDWMREDIMRMHHVVESLRDAQAKSGNDGGASILVGESAGDVIRAHLAAQDAINALHDTGSGASSRTAVTPDPLAVKPRRLMFDTAYDVDVCEIGEGALLRLHTMRFNSEFAARHCAASERARWSPTVFAFTERIRHDEPALCNRCHVPLIHETTIRFGEDADDPIAFCKCPECGKAQTYEV